MDLASIPQMLKNGCEMSAVGKLMVVKDRRGMVVFHAIKDSSGLYADREEDVVALAGRFGDDSDYEEDSRLEGVTDDAKGVLDGHRRPIAGRSARLTSRCRTRTSKSFYTATIRKSRGRERWRR